MWFRNLQLYRLGKAFQTSPEIFEEQLRADEFKSCNSMDMLTHGWTSPLGRHGNQLVHAANGYIMICLRKEEKIIPASVVRQLLDDKVADIESREGREIYRREKMRLKEEIIVDLLPRALSRISNQFSYIDVRNQLLIVDSASPAKAEALIVQLRNTLGRFPATPIKSKQSLSGLMTRWLGQAMLPPDFSLGHECELKHPDPEGGIVSCKKQDLESGEIQTHIKQGKLAVKLALQWQDRLSCVLHEDLSIKRLRFEDIIREAEGDTDADDPVSRFDLDFSLMVLELATFIPLLLEALGGEDVPDGVSVATQMVSPEIATAPAGKAELEPA